MVHFVRVLRAGGTPGGSHTNGRQPMNCKMDRSPGAEKKKKIHASRGERAGGPGTTLSNLRACQPPVGFTNVTRPMGNQMDC
jgi:hypothetical protein